MEASSSRSELLLRLWRPPPVPGSLRDREGWAVGDDEVLEDSGASGRGPEATVDRWTAGCDDSVLQLASLGVVTTVAVAGSVAGQGRKKRSF